MKRRPNANVWNSKLEADVYSEIEQYKHAPHPDLVFELFPDVDSEKIARVIDTLLGRGKLVIVAEHFLETN